MTTTVDATKKGPGVKKAAGGRANGITGILVECLNRALILKALIARGIIDKDDVDDGDTTTETLSVQLWSDITEKTVLKDQCRCKQCRGIGSYADDLCPYCGHDTAEDVDASPATPEAPAAKAAGEEKPMKMSETTEMKKDKPAKEKTNGAAAKADTGSAAIVKDDTKTSSMTFTERDLDTAIRDIQALKGAGAVSMYLLGKRLSEVHAGIWKLRTEKDDKGKEKPKYKTFEAFCTAEIGMTPANAYSLMDVSTHYSEEQVRAWGTSKLDLVLKAPVENRKELEEKIAKGASHREIKEEVQKIKKKTGHVRETRSASGRGGKRSAAATKPSKKAAITVANLIGTATVKLFRKPPSITGITPEKIDGLPRAKKVGDTPFGYEELPNGVIRYYTLDSTPGGELFIRIVTKHAEETEE
jgi:hypothetical protein